MFLVVGCPFLVASTGATCIWLQCGDVAVGFDDLPRSGSVEKGRLLLRSLITVGHLSDIAVPTQQSSTENARLGVQNCVRFTLDTHTDRDTPASPQTNYPQDAHAITLISTFSRVLLK